MVLVDIEMNLIAGQRCPIVHCGGTLLAQKDQFGPRLVCTLCAYQNDLSSLKPFTKKTREQREPTETSGRYEPWRHREKDAWQREIERGSGLAPQNKGGEYGRDTDSRRNPTVERPLS